MGMLELRVRALIRSGAGAGIGVELRMGAGVGAERGDCEVRLFLDGGDGDPLQSRGFPLVLSPSPSSQTLLLTTLDHLRPGP